MRAARAGARAAPAQLGLQLAEQQRLVHGRDGDQRAQAGSHAVGRRRRQARRTQQRRQLRQQAARQRL